MQRLASLALAGVAFLFLIDLFLPWARTDFGRTTAWGTGPGILAGSLAAFLLAWEGARLAGFAADSQIAFVIGATAAILGISTVISLGIDSPNRLSLAYGSWIGLAFSILLLAVSVGRLFEHRFLWKRAGQPA